MTTMTIRTTVDINASAAEAWKLFGEGFGDWAAWAPGIDSSTLKGALAQGVVRVNETPSLGTVEQELVVFDRDGKALSYEMISGLPPMFSRLRNDWSIAELGPGRCRLEGDALFEIREQAAAMKPQLEGKMGMVLEVFAQSVRSQLEGASA